MNSEDISSWYYFALVATTLFSPFLAMFIYYRGGAAVQPMFRKTFKGLLVLSGIIIISPVSFWWQHVDVSCLAMAYLGLCYFIVASKAGVKSFWSKFTRIVMTAAMYCVPIFAILGFFIVAIMVAGLIPESQIRLSNTVYAKTFSFGSALSDDTDTVKVVYRPKVFPLIEIEKAKWEHVLPEHGEQTPGACYKPFSLKADAARKDLEVVCRDGETYRFHVPGGF